MMNGAFLSASVLMCRFVQLAAIRMKPSTRPDSRYVRTQSVSVGETWMTSRSYPFACRPAVIPLMISSMNASGTATSDLYS